VWGYTLARPEAAEVEEVYPEVVRRLRELWSLKASQATSPTPISRSFRVQGLIKSS
jgi:hypothetical protein